MTIAELLQPVVDEMRRESLAYMKSAELEEGRSTEVASAYQRFCVISAGQLRVDAHEVAKIIKKHGTKTIA